MLLSAPFPYFGGKSKIADVVWAALGSDITNYVEPFAGSCAVLLKRPNGAGKTETINDFDGLLANFWRAIRHNPNGVAAHADWPVNECDLHARHLWLVGQREVLSARLMGDPDWYDVKAAGWWVWGACAWIGSGWCSGKGPWVCVDGELVDSRQLPHVGNAGMGINRKLPHVGNAGMGINRKLPHVGDAGRGEYITNLFAALSERFRDVRVACGDFERVLGSSTTIRHGLTGIFLDPPYDAGNHDPYSTCGKGVSERARGWCMTNGNDSNLRIVLAGYEGEHDALAMFGWNVHRWKAHGGYGSQGDGSGRDNKHREVLWMNEACITCV